MPRRSRRSKVKRYRRSFYTREMRLKKAAGIALLVLVVLAAAWLAAPHVLDWATHTWYTVVRDRDLSAPEASSAQAASSQAEEEAPGAASSQAQAVPAASASPAPAAEPENAAQVDPAAVREGSWAEVPVASLGDDAAIRAAAQQLAAEGVAYALIPLKDTAGQIYYPSAVAAASGSIADTTVDPARIAAIFLEYGVTPAAQLAAFQDPVAAYTDRSMAIRYRSESEPESDYLWLDAANAAAGGRPWLNPYADSAVQFVGDLVEELHGMGFGQVVLTAVRFPTAVSSKQDFGATGGRTRAAQLAADIEAWQSRFDGEVTLWFAYSLSQCNGTDSALGAPAPELGMHNLLVEVPAGATMDADARAAWLESAAAEWPVEHLAVRDDAAAYFR